MDPSFWMQVATLIVAVAGVAGGLQALRQGNRQQMLELGNLYIERYWEIDDDLLILPKGSPEHRRARHRYLRLCEDEFEAASRGWLDMKQWVVWHEWLTTPRAQHKIREDLAECSSEEADFARVQRCLRSGVGHTWSACKARPAELTDASEGSSTLTTTGIVSADKDVVAGLETHGSTDDEAASSRVLAPPDVRGTAPAGRHSGSPPVG